MAVVSPDFHVLDFGHKKSGDMFLLPIPGTSAPRQYFLLDSGTGSTVVPPFQIAASGKAIAGIVVTHADSDHYYGLKSMLEEKPLKGVAARWLTSSFSSLCFLVLPPPLTGKKKESSTYTEFKKALLRKVKESSGGRNWVQVTGGLVKVNAWFAKYYGVYIKILSDCDMYVHPDNPVSTTISLKVNMNPDPSPTNGSSVLIRYFDNDGRPYLLTGDAPYNAYFTKAGDELRTMGKASYFLVKIPHHGSINNVISISYSDETVARTAIKALLTGVFKADHYVISCAGDSKGHHPNNELVTALANTNYTGQGSQVHITYLSKIGSAAFLKVDPPNTTPIDINRLDLLNIKNIPGVSYRVLKIPPAPVPVPPVIKPLFRGKKPNLNYKAKVTAPRSRVTTRSMTAAAGSVTKKRKVGVNLSAAPMPVRAVASAKSSPSNPSNNTGVTLIEKIAHVEAELVRDIKKFGAEIVEVVEEAKELVVEEFGNYFHHNPPPSSASPSSHPNPTPIPDIAGLGATSDPPPSQQTVTQAVLASVPTPDIQTALLDCLPYIFAYSSIGTVDMSLWLAKDVKYTPPTVSTLSEFTCTMTNIDSLDVDLGNDLHLQVNSGTDFQLEIYGVEAGDDVDDTPHTVSFNAKLSRTTPGHIDGWDISAYYQASHGSSTLTLWIDKLTPLPLWTHASRVLDLSSASVAQNSIPFFSALPNTDLVGVYFVEDEIGFFTLRKFIGMTATPPDGLHFSLGNYDIAMVLCIAPAESVNFSLPVPDWQHTLRQAKLSLGVIATFVSTFGLSGILSLLPADPSSDSGSYNGELKLVQTLDGTQSINMDTAVGNFFTPNEITPNTATDPSSNPPGSTSPVSGPFLSSLPTFFNTLSNVPLAEIIVGFSYQGGASSVNELGFSLAWPTDIDMPFGIKLKGVWVSIDAFFNPLSVQSAEIAASISWGGVDVLATMRVPSDDTVGSLILNFDGPGQDNLKISYAFEQLGVNILNDLIALPGLSLIAQMPLTTFEIGFDKTLKFDFFRLKLQSQSDISVISNYITLSNATITVEYYVADSATPGSEPYYLVRFAGVCNNSWSVLLTYESADSVTPPTFTGAINFGSSLGVVDCLSHLFGQGDYALESPPASIDMFNSVKIQFVSIVIDCNNWSIYKAHLFAGIEEPVQICSAVSISSLYLDYNYDSTQTVKSTGTFKGSIDIDKDWRVTLAISKTENYGWVFQADAFSFGSGFNISNLVSKLVTDATGFGSMSGYTGLPDLLSGMPDLLINAPSFRVQTAPLAISLSGKITFGGFQCEAEVAAAKSRDTGKWTYGVVVKAAGLGISNAVTLPESVGGALNTDGASFSVVSNTYTPTLFHSDLAAVNAILATQANSDSPLAVGSLTIDFTTSDSGPLASLRNILGIDVLAIAGLLSKTEVDLDIIVTLDKQVGPLSLNSVIFFLRFAFGTTPPSFTAGLKLDHLGIHIGDQYLDFTGTISGTLGVLGVVLNVDVGLTLWRHPFGINFLNFNNVGMSAQLNPAIVAEPLTGVGLRAGISLVQGDDVANEISGSFSGYVTFGNQQAFYVKVNLQNVTFVHIFTFMFNADLPDCFNGFDYGFEKLDLYLCNANMLLPDGVTHVTPAFRCQGIFDMLFLKLFWDIVLPTPDNPNFKVIAAAKPVSFLEGRVSITAADDWQNTFKDIPAYLEVPEEFNGGPAFVLASDPFALGFSAKAVLFMLEAAVSGSLSSSGASFDFNATAGSAFSVKLKAKLDKSGFAAGGALNCNISFDTPAISLCDVQLIDSAHFALDLKLDANAWLNVTSMGFNFSGDFDLTFPIATLKISLPTLDVNVPFKSLATDAVSLIGSTITNNIGALLLSALKNLSNLGKFLLDLARNGLQLTGELAANIAKAFGRGMEEVADMLQNELGILGLPAAEILRVVGAVFNAAASVVRAALQAVGVVVDAIVDVVTDVVNAVGDFFSGLFGGYSNARILKKLSLIGKQLDEAQQTELEILKGLSELNGGIEDAIGEAANLQNETKELEGELWELYGDLDLINQSLQSIDADLLNIHNQNLQITAAIVELAGEVSWREFVVSVTPYVNRIQSCYLQLSNMSSLDTVTAWNFARDVVSASSGVIPALDGIHSIMVGTRAAIPGFANLLVAWANQAAKLSTVIDPNTGQPKIDPNTGKPEIDSAKFAKLIDQFVMNLQSVQKSGLIVLINALKLVGSTPMATAYAKQVHQNLVAQLHIRNQILGLVSAKDGVFFTKDSNTYIILDQRVHQIMDDATKSLLNWSNPTALPNTDANDVTTRLDYIAPLGCSFDSTNTSIVNYNHNSYLLVNTGLRQLPQATITTMGIEVQSKLILSDTEFSQYVVCPDVLDLTQPSTHGFAAKPQSTSGAIVWEQGESGARVAPFDLFKAMPSGRVYLAFEGQLYTLDASNNAIFDPSLLQSLKLIPDAMAQACYPLATANDGKFDSSISLYQMIIDPVNSQAAYYLLISGEVRALQNIVMAQCGFDRTRAVLLSDIKAVQNLGKPGIPILFGPSDSYVGSFAPLRMSSSKSYALNLAN